MTLSDLTIGCKAVIARERPQDYEGCAEDTVVVCTAWPSESVPQFGAVPSEVTRKDLGAFKDGKFWRE